MISVLMLATQAHAIEIPHEAFELENGLEVMLLEDHRLPQVVVDVWYGVGSFDDPTGASGFAHLFEHLMFMGTDRVGQGQFDARMEAAGARNNASTAADYTNYYSWGTSNTLDLLLFLEADRMTGLDITQEKLDLQRDVVRNERRQNYEDPPYRSAWLELPDMLFPESHPYHLEGIGSHEDLLNASLSHVERFYSDWYAPNNATLVVAGDLEPKAVRARIEEVFGPLQPAVVPAHVQAPSVNKPVVNRRVLHDDVPSPAVVMAWHTPSFFEPGDATLDVLADLLSDGEGSRLPQRLVYEEKLAQEVWAYQASQSRGSIFLVWVVGRPGVDPADIETAVREELEALVSERPATDPELTRAVNGFEMGLYRQMESLLERAEMLQRYRYFAEHADYVDEDLARYRAVDAQKVSEIVSTQLDWERAAVLQILPETEEVTP
ncbi:MAG: pitrilysin family protein [Myxococcota bacterium]|nr:pitrilysin family protein [Myxococcota bacterium]